MPGPAVPSSNPGKFVGIFESLSGWAAGRNYLSAVIGIVGALAGIGLLGPDEQKQVIESINLIMEGMGKIGAGLAALIPIVLLVIGRLSGIADSIFGRVKAVNDDAAKVGLRLVVAEDSKVAPLAQALPGPGVTVAVPLQPVQVMVPQPVEPVKSVTMPVLPLLLVLALAPALGGCSATFTDFMAQATVIIARITAAVKPSLIEIRSGIDKACNAIGYAQQEAPTGPNCQSKVKYTVAAWGAFCRDRALLDDDVVGNYFGKIATAVTDVKNACKK